MSIPYDTFAVTLFVTLIYFIIYLLLINYIYYLKINVTHKFTEYVTLFERNPLREKV